MTKCDFCHFDFALTISVRDEGMPLSMCFRCLGKRIEWSSGEVIEDNKK